MIVYCYMPLRCDMIHMTTHATGFSSMENLEHYVKQQMASIGMVDIDVLIEENSPFMLNDYLLGYGDVSISTVDHDILKSPVKIGYYAICSDINYPDSITQFRCYKKSYCNYIGQQEMMYLAGRQTFQLSFDFIMKNQQMSQSELEENIKNIFMR